MTTAELISGLRRLAVTDDHLTEMGISEGTDAKLLRASASALEELTAQRLANEDRILDLQDKLAKAPLFANL